MRGFIISRRSAEVADPAHPGNFESETGIEDENKDESLPRVPSCGTDDFLRGALEHAATATTADHLGFASFCECSAEWDAAVHGGLYGRGHGCGELERQWRRGRQCNVRDD